VARGDRNGRVETSGIGELPRLERTERRQRARRRRGWRIPGSSMEGGVGLRNGGCDWDACTRAGPRGMDLKLGEAKAGRDGDGGESVESQEGEFGAEVSAFLSGAACVWVSVYMYPR